MAYRKTNVKPGDMIDIPGGLNTGSQIIIRGRVLQHQAQFAINLKCGEHEGADIALHINPRNDQGDVVVRNSFQNGSWQNEDTDAPCFPFNNGQKFTIRIMTDTDHYRILVNNKDFVRFNHRIPPEDVRFLELRPGAEYYEASVQNNCRAPLQGYFPGGLKIGQSVRLRGMVTDEANEFCVDFQCDFYAENIGLHFNPRQSSDVVALNAKLGGDWGDQEEKDFDDFPFKRNEYFDLFFIALDDKFNVYVNEKFFTSFNYRCNYRDIRFLGILGDVELMDVEILAPLPDDFIKEIPQGLENNDMVVVKGFFHADGDRFHVNLIKGDSQNDDIALHFNPRRNEDEVVINSRDGGNWETEERHPLPSSMEKMVPFEVEIQAKRNVFKIYANDKKVCKFRARDDIEQIRAIGVGGDAYIYEVKLLRRVDDPFTDSLPGKLNTGNWLTITGAPDDDVDVFAVNLQCGPDVNNDDIAFHFNPRFSQGVVVRNTRDAGGWGEQEMEQPCFPFKHGNKFELAMVILKHGIRVFVNQKYFTDYKFRIDSSKMTHIYLSGGCDYFEPEFY